MAHSTLSKTCAAPPARTSNASSQSFPHTSQTAINFSSHRGDMGPDTLLFPLRNLKNWASARPASGPGFFTASDITEGRRRARVDAITSGVKIKRIQSTTGRYSNPFGFERWPPMPTHSDQRSNVSVPSLGRGGRNWAEQRSRRERRYFSRHREDAASRPPLSETGSKTVRESAIPGVTSLVICLGSGVSASIALLVRRPRR
jgi:hypothetical protein